MRGVPLFSAAGRELVNRGPAWREHPDYYAEDPPEDVEAEQLEWWLAGLPEAHDDPREGQSRG